jgi:hypothetical protein
LLGRLYELVQLAGRDLENFADVLENGLTRGGDADLHSP